MARRPRCIREYTCGRAFAVSTPATAVAAGWSNAAAKADKAWTAYWSKTTFCIGGPGDMPLVARTARGLNELTVCSPPRNRQRGGVITTGLDASALTVLVRTFSAGSASAPCVIFCSPRKGQRKCRQRTTMIDRQMPTSLSNDCFWRIVLKNSTVEAEGVL